MVVHLFAGESNYSHTWLSLFARRFDTDDSCFIIGFGAAPVVPFIYDAEVKKRMLFARKPGDLLKIIAILFKAEWIYFHSLAYDPSLLFWRINKKLIRKSTWIIWGFDLYAFQKKDSLRNRIYEKLRRSIIPAFPEIAAFVEEDAVLAREIYNSTAEYIPILYPIPVETSLLDGPVKRDGTMNILLGNSADPGNYHLEIIDMLAKFAGEAISVICPLSYGGTALYRERVIERGTEVFGTKFNPLLQMMSAAEYAGLLCRVDISVMNHRRQQGLGNILSLLYLGRKVFLRSETSSFSFFKRHNCLVYDTKTIDRMTYSQFTEPLPEDHSNRDYTQFIMSEDNYFNLWSKLINREYK